MNAQPLTILHTSDWHLGRRLYGRMRYDEFEAFLRWLQDTISAQQIDILIVAGDIFDTMTPSNKAQALYFEFLGNVSISSCQHVVIVAGNHDSPTFLDAPSQMLKRLNVHVVGTACEDVNDEVLVLEDTTGIPYGIIAAVPYLRDRDVRSSSAGESADHKDANVIKGIRAHYDAVARIAKSRQAKLIEQHQRPIPIIATGHLFAVGSTTTEDDGVRDLYVGSLGQISADMFDECFDYVALGHLHVPQRVGGREHIRYSGSPIAMGFGEARQQKQVLIITFTHAAHDTDLESNTATAAPSQPFMDDLFDVTPSQKKPITPSHQTSPDHLINHNLVSQTDITALPVPSFQRLAQLSGDLPTIQHSIDSLTVSDTVGIEFDYTGDEIVSDLREKVQTMVQGLSCEVLKIKNARTYNNVINQQKTAERLQDLDERDVFERCLTVNDIPHTQREALRGAYGQILYDLHHTDRQEK